MTEGQLWGVSPLTQRILASGGIPCNEEQAAKIDRLRQQVSEATVRKAALVSEAHEFATKIGEVRDRLGNPFFYSGGNYGRPENADESIANFTGYRSHEPGLRLFQAIRDADRELNTLREQLREMSVGS